MGMKTDVADRMLASDDPKIVTWAKKRYMTLGQPDATRLERARAYYREIVAKLP